MTRIEAGTWQMLMAVREASLNWGRPVALKKSGKKVFAPKYAADAQPMTMPSSQSRGLRKSGHQPRGRSEFGGACRVRTATTMAVSTTGRDQKTKLSGQLS